MPLDLTCADISAYYSLEESDGQAVRVDRKGTSDLSVAGAAVTSAAGIIGNAALFDGATRLTRASTAPWTMNGNVPFSGSLWFYLPTTAVQGLIWKGNVTTALTDWEWRMNTSGSNLLFAVTDGTGTHQASITTSEPWSTNTWTHAAFWYDLTDIKLAINNGTPAAAGYTFGSWNGSHTCNLGASGSPSSVIANGGRIDEVLIARGYAFTANDVTALYNGGAGLSYDAICLATVPQMMQAIHSQGRCSEFLGVRYV